MYPLCSELGERRSYLHIVGTTVGATLMPALGGARLTATIRGITIGIRASTTRTYIGAIGDIGDIHTTTTIHTTITTTTLRTTEA